MNKTQFTGNAQDIQDFMTYSEAHINEMTSLGHRLEDFLQTKGEVQVKRRGRDLIARTNKEDVVYTEIAVPCSMYPVYK